MQRRGERGELDEVGSAMDKMDKMDKMEVTGIIKGLIKMEVFCGVFTKTSSFKSFKKFLD